MNKWGSFCTYCGEALSGDFPRSCPNGHVTYVSGLNIAVALQPVMHQLKIHLLVVQRGIAPFIGEYALPGGFVNNAETPQQAAARELAEETNIQHDALPVNDTFSQAVGTPHHSGNDPRLPMLQFEVMPLIQSDTIDFGYTNSETQKIALVSYDVNSNDLTDVDGKSVTLCFPLHQQAATDYLKLKS